MSYLLQDRTATSTLEMQVGRLTLQPTPRRSRWTNTLHGDGGGRNRAPALWHGEARKDGSHWVNSAEDGGLVGVCVNGVSAVRRILQYCFVLPIPSLVLVPVFVSVWTCLISRGSGTSPSTINDHDLRKIRSREEAVSTGSRWGGGSFGSG